MFQTDFGTILALLILHLHKKQVTTVTEPTINNPLVPFDAGKDSCGVGFVVNVKNKKSHDIVQKGVEILLNLAHRGACGCEPNTGDGAGMLIQIPDKFFGKSPPPAVLSCPPKGITGWAWFFFPRNSRPEPILRRNHCPHGEGRRPELLGWRIVPTDNSVVGPSARSLRACHEAGLHRQVFLHQGRRTHLSESCSSSASGWRTPSTPAGLKEKNLFYVASLSCRTVVYKGMLTPDQEASYFPDLRDPDLESALALIHSRFSTNTFPSWDLAHPFRYIAHNGEINTLRGNINWMHAREALFESDHYTPEEIKHLLPIVREGQSDSATFDNALEILVMGGRSLPHAMMMLIPEAWTGHATMPQYKKDFYRYHSCLMEPWDGPASIAFTDGRVIGAVLDRNGLRPSRYYVTKDDLVIMASRSRGSGHRSQARGSRRAAWSRARCS